MRPAGALNRHEADTAEAAITEQVEASPLPSSRTEYAVHRSRGRSKLTTPEAAAAVPLARTGRPINEPAATVNRQPFNIDELLSDMDLPAPVHARLPVELASSSRRDRAAVLLANNVPAANDESLPSKASQVTTSDPARAAGDLAEGERQLHLWSFDQALSAFERGLRHDLHHVRLRALRFLTLARRAHVGGELDEAQRRYDEALAVDPGCAEAVQGATILAGQRRVSRRSLLSRLFRGTRNE